MNKLKHIALILFGNLCVAVGTVFFLVPAGFITGGATGFALVGQEYLNMPVSLGVAILSIFFLILGWIFLGKKFALSTALSTISYPVFTWICELVVEKTGLITDNTTINLVGVTLLWGFGLALVMRQGASSGGLDTISMILYKKKGVSLQLSVTILEILAMVPQVAYSTYEEIIGGVFLTFLFTAVMNYYIAKGTARVQVMIYSNKHEEILTYIDEKLRRGSTLFHTQGAYMRQDTFVIQTIISNRELFDLKEEVLKVDPAAFMTVSEISQVNGKGFTLDSDVPGDSRKGHQM